MKNNVVVQQFLLFIQTSIQTRMKRIYLMLFGVLSVWHSTIYAELPSIAPPPGYTEGQGRNFILWLQAWWGNIGNTAGLIVSTVLFIWAAWICFSKFNEARSSNTPDWGSVGLTGIVAAGLLIVCGFFLTESRSVINQNQGQQGGGNNPPVQAPI